MNKKTEYTECLTLVDYLETLKTMGKVKLYTHIPMETFTKSWAVKAKNKRMGVRPGFPDYVIVTNKATIFIEMKSMTGTFTEDQTVWLGELNNAFVCQGFEEAKLVIDKFI